MFQVKPSTMPMFNVYDYHENIRAGICNLGWLIKVYKGDKWKAAEAYNCGQEGRLTIYKAAAKRYRRKVSVTYVHMKKSGKLWNIYSRKYSPML